MCAPIKAQHLPELTGAAGWLAIPVGIVGGGYVLASTVGWLDVAAAGVGTVAILGGLLALAHLLTRKRPAPSTSRTARDRVEVLAWIEEQAKGGVWPSDQRRISAEHLRQIEAEDVPVLEAPLDRVLLSGEREHDGVSRWPL